MRRARRSRGWLGWLSILLLLSALGILVGGSVRALVVPAGAGPPELVTVEPGQSASDVAVMLNDRGLIRNANVFAAAAYVTGKWHCIQAGRHELDSGMTGLEIIDALCRGSRKAWRWITIPEGYTLRQVAAKIEDEGLGRASTFLREARRPSIFHTAFPLTGRSLEGYLFPDTYRIDATETERDIIAQMLRRFEQVVWSGLFDAKPVYGGRSLSEILILASLVEAEARRNEERQIIAGVLANRLRLGQRLECDATVQYALGDDRKPRLTYDDLAIESDYNTYLRSGLPPGPICNPGEASIRAAMDPAQVPYLYYVARPDGSHVFTRTFEQHQAAIARVRRGN
jgi:UPF0755 protein